MGSGVGTIEARGSADGVRVSSGATGLDVTDAHIIVNAAGATGNGIENAGNWRTCNCPVPPLMGRRCRGTYCRLN
ncbi:hypothetical protein CWS02_10620 [Enterobacter sp. EA-1]|nr:hypothetical protein CWS02_10620 [Enterobacter sp. EA-1]